MRNPNDVFHLAIPARDLDEAYDFYVTKLGCKLARRYPDRITLDFFGDQLVCHLSDRWDREVSMYPRHFGITFRDKKHFDNLYKLAKQRGIPFYHDLSRRFEGLIEEHETFFLMDPSNNLLEFKYYFDDRMMY
ncbi:VOC family protein [Alicyclobacillus mali]|uniref:VOC family protein n=1 Tax=Alicyclobacillus mali (ex Roth et al. 2021) TaxID=1123961 RepID=A0ABS0F3U0_9BACL|nr:VOC family protein [Alicyclobacillus mali (ex Roth et al. 2021)]MBF8377957.1 VOC family protein [Alicyclobacillus mali (ex Roth et al. 2021)]